MKTIHIILNLSLMVLTIQVKAQEVQDSVHILREILITGTRLENFNSGNKIQKLDSVTLALHKSDNLAEILTINSHAFIKSYGPGNLATIALRGTSAQHTAVLWNGFNIQGPSLGQCDFSLIPGSFMENLEIQYGGSSSLYGSGALGGTIHLNSRPEFDMGLQTTLFTSAASFDTYSQSASIKISTKKLVSMIKLFNASAENNFPYRNFALYQEPVVRQANAAVRQKGVLLENFYKIKNNEQINLRVWLQDNFREIPAAMTSVYSVAKLNNSFCRISSEWNKNGEKRSFAIRSAYFNEQMNYSDSISRLESDTRFHTSVTEAEADFHIRGNQSINLGVNETINYVYSEGYTSGKYQSRTAFFSSYKIENRKSTWNGVLSLRKEIIDFEKSAFSPAFGFDGSITKSFLVKGKVSRNYRLPSFNDLYWNPGGNPDLLPERGWSEEITLMTKGKVKHLIRAEPSLTLFNSNITNWIIWLPSRSYWAPRNIQSVWSRGLEAGLKLYSDAGPIKTEVSLLYSYTVSTNEKTKSDNDNSLKRQLIYVPVYSGQGYISLAYHNYFLRYTHSYTGNRFTSADNTEFLPAYQIGNIMISRSFLLSKSKIAISARINNIWNCAYQVVLWQAMPGRSYQFSVSFSFRDNEIFKKKNLKK